MSGRWRAPAVAIVGIAAVSVAGVLTTSSAGAGAAPRGSTASIDSVTLVCPKVGAPVANVPTTVTVAYPGGRPAAPGTASYRLVVPRDVKATTLRLGPTQRVTGRANYHAVAITAAGPVAAGLAADQTTLWPSGSRRALAQMPCVAPKPDWWFAGADGRVGFTDTLLLANPSDTAANVTVSGWSSRGPVAPARLESVALPAHTATVREIANHFPDAANVALHVHANSGTVTAAVYDGRTHGLAPAGADWIPDTRPPSTHAVVPGYLPGRGGRWLLVANPRPGTATVSLRLSTGRGNFVPARVRSLTVPGGRSVAVDLAPVFAGESGAAVLASDVPVVASGISFAVPDVGRRAPDLQWQAAATALTGRAVLPENTPPFGDGARLLLTAPGAAATVLLTATAGGHRTVTVPAGRSVDLELASVLRPSLHGALVLTAVAGGDVYASRTLYAHGAHGELVTAEQPWPLPAAVVLPPVVEDPRVAIR